MQTPSPSELMERIRALPAARALLARLGDARGVHLVGGAVRELLRGGEPQDLDLVVEGDAAAVARRLGDARVHDRFGTSTAWLDGFTYDFARARSETYARPGALPDVAPASIEADLRRRDFTINAIAVALGAPEPGRLAAVPHALEDLDAGLLRVLHAGSFVDDPTRLLRMTRYAARLGLAIEPGTLALARAAVAAAALRTVSGTRIGTELRLLAAEADPVAAFELLAELELDRAVHPGFGLRDPALARRALELLPPGGRCALVVLALACAEVPAAELPDLLDRLAFTAADRRTLAAGAGRDPALARALSQARTGSEIAAAVGEAPPEVVAIAGALGAEPQARAWLEHLRHVRLEIGGEALRARGVEQGPAIGRALRAALAAKLDGRAAGAEQELAEALREAARKR